MNPLPSIRQKTLKIAAVGVFSALIATVFLIAAPTASAQNPINANRGLPDFADLVDRVGPSVVNISTTQKAKPDQRRRKPREEPEELPFDNDPFFEFFKNIPGMPRFEMPQPRDARSLGSGFIVSSDGYIITNAHVVREADEVTVRLTDKREFDAKIVGQDARSDIALLKINASGLPTVAIGDPQKLRVGQWVVAIGSPFGFDNTVTAGIVSAKGRNLPDETIVPFIQTDAAVNPGNSGGPLLNLEGEVIGVNSQIFSRSGNFAGIAFAIPIDIAMEVHKQLREKGRVSRGRLGIVIQEINKELATNFGLKEASGALVVSVEKGEAGDKAGIKSGDVILEFDGKPIKSSADLPRLVGATAPGSANKIKIWRNGETLSLTAKLGEWKDDKVASKSRNKKGEGGEEKSAKAKVLGLTLKTMDADDRKELGIEGGLQITAMDANDKNSGLQVGDVLVALFNNGKKTTINSVDDLEKAYHSADKSFTILLYRGGRAQFVSLKK